MQFRHCNFLPFDTFLNFVLCVTQCGGDEDPNADIKVKLDLVKETITKGAAKPEFKNLN